MRPLLNVIIILLLYSCNKTGNRKIDIVRVNNSFSENQNISQVFEDAGMVKLETLPECLISYIQQVILVEDWLFVAEPGRVLQFDTSGHFIRQVGSQGHGPGEYQMVGSIAADSITHQLVVSASHYYLFYDFKGHFIRSVPYNGFSEYLSFKKGLLSAVRTYLAEPSDNGTYITTSSLYKYSDQYNVTDSIVIKKIVMEQVIASIGGHPNYISDLKTGLYLYYPVLLPESILRDTLYEITGNKISPSLKFDFSDLLVLHDNHKNILITNIFRTNRYIFAEYNNTGNPYLYCYDFKEKTGYHLEKGFNDNFYGTGIAELRPLNLNNNKFYFIKNGYEIEDLTGGVNENSNPLVFFVRTKE